jgi:hypothetical protein
LHGKQTGGRISTAGRAQKAARSGKPLGRVGVPWAAFGTTIGTTGTPVGGPRLLRSGHPGPVPSQAATRGRRATSPSTAGGPMPAAWRAASARSAARSRQPRSPVRSSDAEGWRFGDASAASGSTTCGRGQRTGTSAGSRTARVYLLRKGRDCDAQVDSLTIAAPPLGSRTQLQAHNPQRLRRPAGGGPNLACTSGFGGMVPGEGGAPAVRDDGVDLRSARCEHQKESRAGAPQPSGC